MGLEKRHYFSLRPFNVVSPPACAPCIQFTAYCLRLAAQLAPLRKKYLASCSVCGTAEIYCNAGAPPAVVQRFYALEDGTETSHLRHRSPCDHQVAMRNTSTSVNEQCRLNLPDRVQFFLAMQHRNIGTPQPESATFSSINNRLTRAKKCSLVNQKTSQIGA